MVMLSILDISPEGSSILMRLIRRMSLRESMGKSVSTLCMKSLSISFSARSMGFTLSLPAPCSASFIPITMFSL